MIFITLLIPHIFATTKVVVPNADISAEEFGDLRTAQELVKQVAPNQCLLRLEHGYWHFAFCPSLIAGPVRQFFSEGGKYNHLNAPTKYVLGTRFVSEKERLTPKFYAQYYDSGTPCDSTKKPARQRSVEVRYYCNPKLKQDGIITEVSEPSPCEYQISIETPHLCEHRAFSGLSESTSKTAVRPKGIATIPQTALPPAFMASTGIETIVDTARQVTLLQQGQPVSPGVSSLQHTPAVEHAGARNDETRWQGLATRRLYSATRTPLPDFHHDYDVRRVPDALAAPRRRWWRLWW